MNMELSLAWMYDKVGRITYSMVYRNGPSSYDCSSAVYHSLKAGGYIEPDLRIGNTDTLFRDLETRGWTQLQPNVQGNFDTQRGDIFIWGHRGASGGAAGHTGEFVNANDVIHCSGGYNGMHVDNYDQLAGWNGNPEQAFYRYTGTVQPAAPAIGDTDQNVDVGSYIKLDKAYTVNDVQNIGGIWQVRTDELCPVDFTWDDNGIPVEPLVEIEDSGYATVDQDLAIGSQYKIPGKFTVLDLGLSNDIWMAQIEAAGLKFWVDIETATEVLGSDTGTPTPVQRPASDTPIAVPPKETDPIIQLPPVTPPVVTVPETPVITLPPITQPTKEKPQMAFSPEQAKELQVQQALVLDNDSSDFTPVISDRVKTVAYFATDIGAVASTFVFTVLGYGHVIDAIDALGYLAATVALLQGVKQIFRISAKK